MQRMAIPTSIVLGVGLLVAAWVIYEPPVEDAGEVVAATPAEVRPPLPTDPPEVEPRPDVAETLFPPAREHVAPRSTPDPESTPDPGSTPDPDPSWVRFEGLPTTIEVPAIGVDHPLIPVGLNPDGSMEIPHDVQEIGWYEPQGILPGDHGTAVLAGHVDSRSQGRGAFYDLRHLDVGDLITITDRDQQQEWVVTARRSYDKNLIPIDEIFVDHGDPRLVLITCGGAFDRTARSYRDNIVVYATLR